MRGPRPKVENPGKLLKRVLSLIFRHYGWACAGVALCIVGTALATVQGSLFLKSLIDDYIDPMLASGSRDFGPLAAALVRIAAIYGVGVLCSWAQSRIMITVSQGTLRDLRVQVFQHMESLPISYFDTHAHGDIMSVYTNDIDTLRQMISQSLPDLASSLVTIISVFISMVILNVPLTVLTCVMVAVILFVSQYLAKNSARFFVEQQKNLGSVNGYIEEMMEGQKVVKVFCHEQENLEGFLQRNEALRVSAANANRFANIMMPTVVQLGNCSYALCAVLGAALAVSGGWGGVTLGTLVSFLTLNKNFTRPFSQISQQANSVVMALAGAQRIFALLDEKSETDEGQVTLVKAKYDQNDQLTESAERTGLWAWKQPQADGSFRYTKVRGDIVFDHVDFGYVPEKTVLHDIQLYGRPGQKIAFVGSTGAGKTTITNLINRFYDIQEGTITYDGIDVKDIAKDSLRRSLGMVLQDTHLFTGTIADNIRYGKLDATDEEIRAAAKLANADSFIRHLPQGYDTVITGDGAGLSQGERQLLAIARAAVSDPPVLILDEATSSIDTRTETLIEKGMDSLMEGRTVFVIAHRLSTVRNAQAILVLENGQIIERGDHAQLLEEKGRYYQLYTGQAKLS